MTKNILLVGVGGQGTILASKILSIGFANNGYDVKMSEIHGMSQRGGYSEDKVYSPVVELGQADLIVAFEKMEALRYLDYLKPNGKIVVNDCEIPGTPITSGTCEYPQNILEELKAHADVTVFDANKEAEKLVDFNADVVEITDANGNRPYMLNVYSVGSPVGYTDSTVGHTKKRSASFPSPLFQYAQLYILE